MEEVINQSYDFMAGFTYTEPMDIWLFLKEVVWDRIVNLIEAPVLNKEMLWIVIPILVALVLMQLYFGRNKDEAIGWNTAFGNAIVLLFTGFNLLHYLYRTYGAEYTDISVSIKVLIGFILIIEGVVLMFFDFFHFLPAKVAFFFGSSITNGVTAYTAIVLVYSQHIPIDIATILAAIVIFAVLLFFFRLFRKAVPASERAKMHLLEMKLDSLKKKRKKKKRSN